MALIRWLLIALSAAALIFMLFVIYDSLFLHRNSYDPKRDWVIYVITPVLALNIYYLYVSRCEGPTITSRLIRILHLWLEAKEEELKQRTRQSKKLQTNTVPFLGTERTSSRQNESPEASAIFERIHTFLNDERAQNNRLPESYRLEIQGGLDCDEISDASGEFGRSIENPIPVNGPIGEILYLSNLRTDDRTPIMFHRIGSKNGVDVFEAVSLDGNVWDILFLHLYHPRKSRRAPSGYSIAQGKERQDLFLGTSEFVDGFPRHIQEAAGDAFQQWVGMPMRTPELRRALEQGTFNRPKQHQDHLTATLSILDIKEM